MAKNGRNDAKYVFTSFEPSSGWPDGWSFMVGLLHAGYATSSTGMIIGMCEEVQEPAVQVPKAMVLTIIINTFAGLLFLIPIIFVMPEIATLDTIQPVPPIILSAVGKPGAAIALLIPLMVLAIMCGIACTTAASRCTWAFARDGAIPGSKWWIKVNKKLDVPLNAMMLSMVVQIVLAVINFGSAAAFAAFSGVGVIALTAAYACPIAISLFTGRKQVAAGRFYYGKFGMVCNVIALGKLPYLLFSSNVSKLKHRVQLGPLSPCPSSVCPVAFPLMSRPSTTPLLSSSQLWSSPVSGTWPGDTKTTPVPRLMRSKMG